ncbi:MAG: energy-coupling factor transporter transmembrane component T family protein [Chloroflexota bacterium]
MILEARGPLGAIDTRIKLAWVITTVIAGLSSATPLPLVALLASILAVAFAGKVLVTTFERLKGLGTIIVILGLILGVTVPGESLASFGPISVSAEGMQLGLVSMLRMLVFAAPLIIVVMTSNNSDLIAGFMALRLPLDYALMMVLALNFVPLYLEEFGRIADAQKARAHALVEQGLLGRVRGLIPIFVPLTLNAIDRADTVGKVLEIRGLARRRFNPAFEPLGIGSWALLALAIGTLVIPVVVR